MRRARESRWLAGSGMQDGAGARHIAPLGVEGRTETVEGGELTGRGVRESGPDGEWWRLTAFAGVGANARSGNARHCAPGQHSSLWSVPLPRRATLDSVASR